MLKFFLFLLSLIILSSCSKYWYKPYGKHFKSMPKGGSPGFELGWEHGCQSGFATQFPGPFYRYFYHWERDVDLISSNVNFEKIRKKYKHWKINWCNKDEVIKNLKDYKKIFWNAHAFCRHSALGLMQTAGMTPPQAGHVRYDPGAHHLGSVYKIDSKGDTRLSYW